MIRIVVADDHHLVRQSVVSLLEKNDGIEVVGQASNGYEAIKLIKQKRPDVALLDIAMPQLNGLETTRRIMTLDCNTRVIILSIQTAESVIRQALLNGASGYLLKSSVVEELLIAIRSACNGEIYLSPPIAQKVLLKYMELNVATETTSVRDRLSSREQEILQLIVENHTNSKIAQILNLSIKTVEKHRASLMKKLDVRTLPDLIIVAIKHKLVFMDE